MANRRYKKMKANAKETYWILVRIDKEQLRSASVYQHDESQLPASIQKTIKMNMSVKGCDPSLTALEGAKNMSPSIAPAEKIESDLPEHLLT